MTFYRPPAPRLHASGSQVAFASIPVQNVTTSSFYMTRRLSEIAIINEIRDILVTRHVTCCQSFLEYRKRVLVVFQTLWLNI